MFQIYNVLLKNPTSELDNPVYFFEHIIIINNNNTLRRMEVFTLVFLGRKVVFSYIVGAFVKLKSFIMRGKKYLIFVKQYIVWVKNGKVVL